MLTDTLNFLLQILPTTMLMVETACVRDLGTIFGFDRCSQFVKYRCFACFFRISLALDLCLTMSRAWRLMSKVWRIMLEVEILLITTLSGLSAAASHPVGGLC
jgi:hypothetical protein